MSKKTGYIHKFKSFVDKYRHWKKRFIVRNYQRFRYVLWLKIKSASFKSRPEKIKEFEKIVHENPHIYFTTDLVKTGFTDQLIGFSFLYKLGLGLGLKYYHTRLSSHRSSNPFLLYPYSKDKLRERGASDVFDFLGLNSFLEARRPIHTFREEFEEILIRMDAVSFRSGHISSYETLLEEMKVMLFPFVKAKRKILLRFEAGPPDYFKYYRYVAHRTDHELDFLQVLKESRRGKRHKSKFKEGAVKMMVHIRQGDTGTLKTPWGTYISTWYETKGKYTQFKNREDIKNRRILDPDDFHLFLKDLLNSSDTLRYSAVLYSDGFKKTFKSIYQYYKSKNITHKEIEQLKEVEPIYDEQQFEKFRELGEVETVIGEDVEKLYDLIDSFMESEVFIFGTQGLMIPKILATYGCKTHMPLMIMLYKSDRPYLNHIGLDNSADYLIFVDIHNYDIAKISQTIENFLKRRNSLA